MLAPGRLWSRSIRRSASGNGSGLRTTRCTRVKTATLAAIASASVATVVSEKIGALTRRRAAWESSRSRPSIPALDDGGDADVDVKTRAAKAGGYPARMLRKKRPSADARHQVDLAPVAQGHELCVVM